MQPFGTKTTLLSQAVAEIYLFLLMHAGRGSKTKTTLLSQAVAEIYLFLLMHAGRGSNTSFSVISWERLGLETSYSCQNIAFGSPHAIE